ncbi:MAG: hypothetical protein H7144_17580 [Burkholderiales bacterium]|nr:hypothetical protein [Phycisphaerae bacterium]
MPLDFFQNVQHSPRFHAFTFGVSEMPLWARFIVAIPLIPGVLLVGLSLLAVLASILALLLITVPVYLLVKWITGVKAVPREYLSSGSRRVQATVRDV